MGSAERLVLGLDIGGTNARAALVRVDAAGQASLVTESRSRIRDDTTPARIVSEVGALARQCASQAAVALESIAGLGMGFAGQLSQDGRVVLNSPNLGWRDVALASQLEAALPGLPVRIVNDLSAIAWGEYRCGGGRGYDDLLVVYLGTGLGSGLVLGGRLYEGAGGKAGELGHTKVHGSEVACACGQVGCVEALVGGKSIEARLARDVASGAAASLVAWLGESLRGGAALTAAEVERGAVAGERYALSLWEEVSSQLGDVLSGAVGLLNPSGLLLGGGVLENAPELRARVVGRMSVRTVAVSWPEVRVLCPELGDDAGVLGAGLLLLESVSRV